MSLRSKSVFVVLGEQGEYSDREVWAAAVFEDEGLAKRFVEEQEAALRQVIIETTQYSDEREKRLQAIDPAAVEWGDDVPRYFLEEVPFR